MGSMSERLKAKLNMALQPWFVWCIRSAAIYVGIELQCHEVKLFFIFSCWWDVNKFWLFLPIFRTWFGEYLLFFETDRCPSQAPDCFDNLWQQRIAKEQSIHLLYCLSLNLRSLHTAASKSTYIYKHSYWEPAIGKSIDWTNLPLHSNHRTEKCL